MNAKSHTTYLMQLSNLECSNMKVAVMRVLDSYIAFVLLWIFTEKLSIGIRGNSFLVGG